MNDFRDPGETGMDVSAATARTDDERRFARLVSDSQRRLVAYAVRRLDVPADAADIVAETYLVAWRRLADAPEGDAAVPWLFGIARRVLANHYRGERRRLALADRLRTSILEQTYTPEPIIAGQTAIGLALARLDPDDRELVLLEAWDGLNRVEIATALGITRAAVRTRMHRARKRLAVALADVRVLENAAEYAEEGVVRPAFAVSPEPSHRQVTVEADAHTHRAESARPGEAVAGPPTSVSCRTDAKTAPAVIERPAGREPSHPAPSAAPTQDSARLRERRTAPETATRLRIHTPSAATTAEETS